jgi:phosphomannomutase
MVDKIYIFDIDGTLTPSRLPMDKDFKDFFLEFIDNNRVWFVTGSDKDKTIEQIGEDLWLKAERCYQSSGNVLYKQGELIHKHDFELPQYYEDMLNILLEQSEYPVRAGNHIEKRIGTVNFSVVGRDCTQDQREAYAKWDEETEERKNFAWELNQRYHWFQAVVGGQISIDIFERGKDKGQIVDELINEEFEFFGDHMSPGGNDYPVIKQSMLKGIANKNKFHEVKDWQHTYNILKQK